ncbi:peptide/nickel transport system permease protein [Kribbella orskensis]|uniref:Peptide/nickel transport system permease protein n=1 Tax=Kribbella orskensis TaxID=2512216 RepID=A0ABY2BI29_9ACTN|nr:MULTISPECIES: ABC transporter permease [Kribbella]TCN38326.1 peptide/nickel transport system permease protein [Kribbella sp. VKM Ac-2500]TCO20144.1 peptide/nickel transport system permease protein [Kribbella orskensis]
MLQQTETLEPPPDPAPDRAGPEVVKSLRDHGALPQWRLMWRQFRRHKLALIGLIVLVPIYFVAIFAGFFAPASSNSAHTDLPYAPPQRVHVSTEHGLFVYGYQSTRNQETFEQTFTVDRNRIIDVGLFVRGDEYKLLGLIPSDIHLIGPKTAGQPFFLLGADHSGRDLLSRLIEGARVSLSIGLVGVFASFLLGMLIGGISGYCGGRVDNAIQRVIEFIMSIPTLPLWMALSAALPASWGPLTRYFAITVILSLIGWTGLARDVRGRFLSLREEDFVMAARLDGCGRGSIIFGHLVPNFASHIIASVSMAVPRMILGETSLSFLGLGLQAPAVSWGVLLEGAQNIRAVATAPWLLTPGLAVVVVVLAMNFVGDGLRDAADPYK